MFHFHIAFDQADCDEKANNNWFPHVLQYSSVTFTLCQGLSLLGWDRNRVTEPMKIQSKSLKPVLAIWNLSNKNNKALVAF